jgi:hypothetical protein
VPAVGPVIEHRETLGGVARCLLCPRFGADPVRFDLGQDVIETRGTGDLEQAGDGLGIVIDYVDNPKLSSQQDKGVCSARLPTD